MKKAPKTSCPTFRRAPEKRVICVRFFSLSTQLVSKTLLALDESLTVILSTDTQKTIWQIDVHFSSFPYVGRIRYSGRDSPFIAICTGRRRSPAPPVPGLKGQIPLPYSPRTNDRWFLHVQVFGLTMGELRVCSRWQVKSRYFYCKSSFTLQREQTPSGK